MGQCASERISVTGESANYNVQATILRKCGKYEEALEMYNKAIDSNPYNFRAFDGIGTTYIRMKSYELAREWCKKAIKKKSEKAYYIQGANIKYIEGYLDFLEEDYQKAIQSFSKVNLTKLKLPEYYIWSQYFCAYCHWKLEEYGKALVFLQLASDKFQSLDCYYLKGAIYAQNQQIEEATEILSLTVELQEMQWMKLPIKLKQQNYKYIINCIENIVQVQFCSTNRNIQFQFLYVKAYLFRVLKHHNDALKTINSALEIQQNNIQALQLLSYLQQGKSQLETIDKIIEINPQYKQGYFRKAFYYYKQQEYKIALEFNQQAIEIDKNYEVSIFLKFCIEIAQGIFQSMGDIQNIFSPFANIQYIQDKLSIFKQQTPNEKQTRKTYKKLQILLEQIIEMHEKPKLNLDLLTTDIVNKTIKQIRDPYLQEFVEYCETY